MVNPKRSHHPIEKKRADFMSDERKTLQQEERKPQRTQIMTLKEVAKYLGVHTMTVYRLLKEKKLPGFKVGGQWRTKKDVLDSYLLKEIDRGGQDSKKK